MRTRDVIRILEEDGWGNGAPERLTPFREAIAFHIEGMLEVEDGLPVPPPSARAAVLVQVGCLQQPLNGRAQRRTLARRRSISKRLANTLRHHRRPTPPNHIRPAQSWWARGDLNPHVLADTGT